eukprot:scaffold104419_cov41-Prasinocladus_malaysianus.AAC.2
MFHYHAALTWHSNRQFGIGAKSNSAGITAAAVIENYSLRCSLDLIKNEHLDFLSAACANTMTRRKSDELSIAKLHIKLKTDFRRTIITMVLATDMSKHFDILAQFNTTVRMDPDLSRLKCGSDKWDVMSHAQKMITLQVALKV